MAPADNKQNARNNTIVGKITIDSLIIHARHGVLDQERRVGNDFIVDIVLDVPAAVSAEESDELADTVNYADVVEIVRAQMRVPSRLLEHVAGRIRRAICQRYPGIVAGGSVTIRKPAPPIPAQIGYVAYTTIW